MIRNIAYSLILGKPVIMYLGIITLISLLTTATLGLLVYRGKIKFRYHWIMAITTITLALIHATLGLSAYFNF